VPDEVERVRLESARRADDVDEPLRAPPDRRGRLGSRADDARVDPVPGERALERRLDALEVRECPGPREPEEPGDQEYDVALDGRDLPEELGDPDCEARAGSGPARAPLSPRSSSRRQTAIRGGEAILQIATGIDASADLQARRAAGAWQVRRAGR
jgi:hypothetical protein